jgi:ubiquinone/menaquinone biosynthesis C-methylase UbiE
MESKRDCWTEWLADRRFGGDAELKRELIEKLGQRRDDVLDHSGLAAGERLLDVGCGEGLIGFGALERGAGSVVFSDISEDLTSFCREAAGSIGVLERCEFVVASADDLSAIGGETVDVVTTRSVLIYVANKRQAFAEFFRVLQPGGRVSLYEPINSFAQSEPTRFWGYDVSPIADVATKVRALYQAIQPAESDPMLNFDDRDLIHLCEQAGFFPVNLLLHLEITPHEPRTWETFLGTSGNPKIPTIAEAMEQTLSGQERNRFTAHLRPLVENGNGVWRMGHAYLWAAKPV